MLGKKEKMKNGISIGMATPDDVVGIQEVFYKTWLATYPNKEVGITVDDIEERYKDRLSESELIKKREQMANIPEGQIFLVAKDKDMVIGLCRAAKNLDRNQLRAIYVLPEYQGRGIGGKLWEQAKEFFDSTKDIYVEVATYNDNAISFYNKLGFIETGRRFSDEKMKLKSGSMIPEMEMVIRV